MGIRGFEPGDFFENKPRTQLELRQKLGKREMGSTKIAKNRIQLEPLGSGLVLRARAQAAQGSGSGLRVQGSGLMAQARARNP